MNGANLGSYFVPKSLFRPPSEYQTKNICYSSGDLIAGLKCLLFEWLEPNIHFNTKPCDLNTGHLRVRYLNGSVIQRAGIQIPTGY